MKAKFLILLCLLGAIGLAAFQQPGAPSQANYPPASGSCSAAGNGYYGAAGSTLSCDTSVIDNGSGAMYFTSATGPFISSLNANNGEFGVNATVSSGWSGSGLKLGSTGILIMTSGALSGTSDTGISRGGAAGVVAIGNGSAGNTTAQVKAAAYSSVGTTFTSSGGCTEGTLTGGATAGKFTTSGSTGCTTTVTMGNSVSAPNGWSCTAIDLTTVGDVTDPHQTASTQTTATFATGTIVANDVIQFSCFGY